MIRKICFFILLAFAVSLTCFLANAPCESPKSTTASTPKTKSPKRYNPYCFDGIIVAAGRWHHYQRWLENTKRDESGQTAKDYILAHSSLVPGTENINNNVAVDEKNNPVLAMPDESEIRPGRIVWVHGRGSQEDVDSSKKGGSRVMDHVLICTDRADWKGEKKELFELNNYCIDDNENPQPTAPTEPAKPDECNIITITDRLNQTVVSKRNAPKNFWDYLSDPFNYNVSDTRKTFKDKPFLECKAQVFEWKDTDTVETRTHLSEKELREVVIELYARYRVRESDRIRTELKVNTKKDESGITGVELKRDKENNTVVVTKQPGGRVESKVYLPDGTTITKQTDNKGLTLSTKKVLPTGNTEFDTIDVHGNIVSSYIRHDGWRHNTTTFPDDGTTIVTDTDENGKIVDNKAILPGEILVTGKTDDSGNLLTTVENLSDPRVRRYLGKYPDLEAVKLEGLIDILKIDPGVSVDEIDPARLSKKLYEYQSKPEVTTTSGPALPFGVGTGFGVGISRTERQGGGFTEIGQRDEVVEGTDYGGEDPENVGQKSLPGAGVVEEIGSGTDDTAYCPEDIDELKAKCAQVNGYIRAFESQGPKAKWAAGVQRAYLFRAQCCGYRWTTEGPEYNTGQTTATDGADVEFGDTRKPDEGLMGVTVDDKDRDMATTPSDADDQNWFDEYQDELHEHRAGKHRARDIDRTLQDMRRRQQQVANDPEWQMLMERNQQNLRDAGQGLSDSLGPGSSGSSSSGPSYDRTRQQTLPYMEKDPYKNRGYRKYQREADKKKQQPSSKGTGSTDRIMDVDPGDTTVPGEDNINDYWPSR